MLDMTTLRKLHEQLNQDAKARAIALYALFEGMEVPEVQYSANVTVGNRTKTGRLSCREVTVTIRRLGSRSFIVFDYPQDALAKLNRQEVAA